MTNTNKRIIAAVILCVSLAMLCLVRVTSSVIFPKLDFDDAVRLGDVATVKTVLAGKPELVNTKDTSGRTPLFRASEIGNKELVEVLLSYKADINAKDNKGETPLNWMAMTGNRNGVEVLLSLGADVNAANNRGYTPLHNTAIMNRKEIAELLLEHHADINAKTRGDKGGTPLDIALMLKKNEMADFLRAHGGKTSKELEKE